MRLINEDEREAFVRSVMVPFLDPDQPDDEIAYWVQTVETDRSWVEEEGGRFVANAAIDTMNVTVPGGAVLPMAGVTAVGVHPTHRRRGILTQLMKEMLDDARRRGEPLAGLLASESVIYGRFGFGHASDRQEWKIKADRSAFTGKTADTDIRLVNREEATDLLPDLFERCRKQRAGEPNRTAHRWHGLITDRRRDHGKGAFVAVSDSGFVRYRLASNEDDLIVEDLFATDPDAEAALWRFVFDIDLVDHVIARRRPVDEPVRWRLRDPRQMHVTLVEDMLWLRILDVEKALTSRHWHARGRLVLELTEPAVPDPQAAGSWLLEAAPEGSTCTPTDKPADLRMGIADLGSLYLGGFRATALAAAGRIVELTDGALASADLLFTTPLAPRTSTGF